MEIIDIYKHPKQENKTKQAKPPKWSKQNDRNETNLTTKTKRPKRSKKYTKNNGVNPGKMNGCHAGVSRHFLSFRLWPIPDLPHGKIQWSLAIAIGLVLCGDGTSIKKKTINKRVSDIDVVTEYRYLLSLLSVYASVLNEAGVPYWKLHIIISVKL